MHNGTLDTNIDGLTNDEMSKPTTNLTEKLFQTAKNPKKAMNNALGFIALDYWKKYFDVTQYEVYERIVATLNPISPAFSAIIDNKVDFYGPFWICALLVFVYSVAGTLGGTLHELL